jgi:transposase InsO family protein
MRKTPRNRKKARLLPIPVEGPFDRVAVDCLGPFPESYSGNRYVVVFSDYLTRWPEAFAVSTTEATVIAKLLVNDIFCRHGAPKTLLSDRGRNFLSTLVREVCHLLSIDKINTSAYHPMTDGLVERFNSYISQSLSMFVSDNQKDWDEYLPAILFAYRTSPQATTGDSPFYLLYGREPRLPLDITLLPPKVDRLSTSIAEHRARIVSQLEEAQRLAKQNTERTQQQMKERYDLKTAPVPFTIGQRVWVFTPKTRKGLSKKLLHRWHGPYRIVEKLSPVNFRLRTAANRLVSVPVHANRMKPYFDANDRPIEPPPDYTDSDTFALAEAELPVDSFAPDVPDTELLATTDDMSAYDVDNDVSTQASLVHAPPDSNSSDDGIYQIEKILQQRQRQGKKQYLVKW